MSKYYGADGAFDLDGRTAIVTVETVGIVAQMMGKYFIDNKINGCIVNMASQAGVIALDKHAASPTVIPAELGHKTRDGPANVRLNK